MIENNHITSINCFAKNSSVSDSLWDVNKHLFPLDGAPTKGQRNDYTQIFLSDQVSILK